MPSPSPEPNLGDLLEQVADWGDRTFPRSTWLATSTHLVHEAEEVREAEGDGEELADVLIMVAHLARSKGINLAAEVEKKWFQCQFRRWLPPDRLGAVYQDKTGVSHEIANLISTLHHNNWPARFPVEHAYMDRQPTHERGPYAHEILATTPPTYTFRIVIFHAATCGCDSIPDEVVLHG